ncbi:MAG: nucleoside triphosphate hydrolase [Alphaproteobacteria bacterium]|nr:nucleoside triphosphate hydrolase [Alphaproteobacteria bacterium]
MNTFEKLTLLESQADEFGFMWHAPSQILDQIQSECEEIKQTLKQQGGRNHLQEEIGDLIHAAFSLCLFCEFDAEETMVKSIDKFEIRFNKLKRLVHESAQGSLKGQPVEVLMDFWNQAKQRHHRP